MKTIEDFVYRGKNMSIFEAEKAIAYLLNHDVAFINRRPYVINSSEPKEKWITAEKETTVVL